ncbi:MAG: MFS transporter [Dehalococcoidales bacterium]|nr:MFS transporter [Dehalococcoidales bacterium]
MSNRNRPRSANAVQATNRITGPRRWWALGTVLLTLFFGSLDQTVVSTAIPVIVGDLKGFDIYAWVFTSYLITSAVTVPIYGKLSDIYGRRPFYIIGLSIFMVGSALSGQSRTMTEVARPPTIILATPLCGMSSAGTTNVLDHRSSTRWRG